MKQFLKLLQWTLNAAVFFTLFAFALNNQHEAKVYFFFGTQWRSPMVLIVLLAFAMGMVVGVLGVVPRWWRQKQAANTAQASQDGNAQIKTGQQQDAGSSNPSVEVNRGT
jgi:uncharacterized integral membrane protein